MWIVNMCDKQIWLESLPYYKDIVDKLGEYDNERKYVGAEGDWKSKLIPRTIWGIDVNMAAYVHDYWYNVGGDSHARFVADALFLVDMMRLIEMSNSWRITRFMARNRAAKYYGAVRENGSSAFNYRIV